LTGEDILILGGTGTLGSRLVRQLAAGGVRPRVLVRTPEKADALASLAAPVVGDLLAPESLEPAFRSVERVFVLGQPTPDMEALERNAIDAAVAAGARRIVYLSNFTARVDSELRPNHIHAVHERLVASLGIEWTVLGPTRYMTNFPFDWASVLNDGLLLETGGDGVMTCIDPDDVAEIAVKVLTEGGHNGQTYRLTSQDAFTAAALAALLSDVAGREVRVAEGGPAGYFALVAAGMYFPTETASTLLGRAPRTYRDWLRQNASTLIGRFAQT
jgi:uncharacterized protein YbjT (DUF2867 family)